jgi:uncharacterized membrane protein YccC
LLTVTVLLIPSSEPRRRGVSEDAVVVRGVGLGTPLAWTAPRRAAARDRTSIDTEARTLGVARGAAVDTPASRRPGRASLASRIDPAHLEALKAAARAAIVMPAAFAFADQVVGRLQTSLFAAFGSMALLVFTEFGGPPRRRLASYLAFAACGVPLIVIGTLCSRDAWPAAAVTAVVAFGVLFGGGFSGFLAAATQGAILLFVLPACIPAPDGAVPDRLLGWGIATAASITALFLLWPPMDRQEQRRAAARAMRAVVALLEEGSGPGGERADEAKAETRRLTRAFVGSQRRPGGPSAVAAALAALPDELDWLTSFLVATPGQPPLEVACPEEAEVLAAAAAVLGASAERLEGGSAQPDFERLSRAKEEVAGALARRLSDQPDIESLRGEFTPAFRVRGVGYAAREVAIYAMRATGGEEPPLDEADIAAVTPEALGAAQRVAAEQVNVRSVWLQNSIRGALALGIAVFIAQRVGLQHGFWAVLGTLSVLRSNAFGTSRSVLGAIAGTGVGIVVGALLVIAIGSHPVALWIALAPAVLFAVYAPRAISFAAGQAGFTVVLLVLFNLIDPVGWRVGLVRAEDVAIGFAVSLGVGLLLWPRGAATQLRRDLAAAFARGADAVRAAADDLLAGSDRAQADRSVRRADAALHRLDDAFSQYLAEGPARTDACDLAALVCAAGRVRRVAQSLMALASKARRGPRVGGCGLSLEPEVRSLHDWYAGVGDALVRRRQVPPPHRVDADGRAALVECVRRTVAGGGARSREAALIPLWTMEHVESLRRLEARIAAHTPVASPRHGALLLERVIRRQPAGPPRAAAPPDPPRSGSAAPGGA